jgi:regulatory protein
MDDALQYALQLLARRDYTVSDLETRLLSRYSDSVSGRTIEKLRAEGLLDDCRFAANFVRSHRGRGPRRLLAELTRRGVDADLANEILEEQQWPSLEEAIITTLKEFGISPPLTRRAAARLGRSLYRLGYDAEEIRCELERLL